MKTVQEWLNEVNTKTLVDTYLANYPVDYQMISDQELTLGEIRDRSQANLTEFIQRMKFIEVRTDTEPKVFFACEYYQNGEDDVVASMCGMDELCTAENPESYAWDLSSFSEVMGYYIVETKLTMDKIYDVLASILDELTFFGFDPEETEKENVKEELRAAIEEIEGGKFDTEKATTLEDLWSSLGLKPREPDPEGDELKHNILAAEYAYNAYQRRKEVANARELLRDWQGSERGN